MSTIKGDPVGAVFVPCMFGGEVISWSSGIVEDPIGLTTGPSSSNGSLVMAI